VLQPRRGFPRDRLLFPAARLGRVHTAARHPGDDRRQGVQSPPSAQCDACILEEAGRLSQCSVYFTSIAHFEKKIPFHLFFIILLGRVPDSFEWDPHRL